MSQGTNEADHTHSRGRQSRTELHTFYPVDMKLTCMFPSEGKEKGNDGWLVRKVGKCSPVTTP